VIGGRVLDASALLDAATGRTVYLRAFLRTAVEVGVVLLVPATALQDAWASSDKAGRVFLDGFLDHGVAVVQPLTATTARAAGLAGAAARGLYTTTAAQVVTCALERGWPVMTTDPRPLEAIDPHVLIERLP